MGGRSDVKADELAARAERMRSTGRHTRLTLGSPTYLHVAYVREEREARHSVHQDALAQRGPASGAPAEVQRRLHVDEWQRDELRQPAPRIRSARVRANLQVMPQGGLFHTHPLQSVERRKDAQVGA